MFLSLRSPQGPWNRSVCFASNSCLTTALLKARQEKRRESFKCRHQLFCHLLLSKPVCQRLCRLSTHGSSTGTFPAHERLSHPSSPPPRVIHLLGRSSCTKSTPGQVKIHPSRKDLTAIMRPQKISQKNHFSNPMDYKPHLSQ